MENHSNFRLDSISRKYEERILNIIQILTEINIENDVGNDCIQTRLDNELIDIDKLIEDNTIKRICGVHKINMALIGKLKEYRYDFNDERSHINNYESILNNSARYLRSINLNES